ncbi:MAG: TRAP transporter small permease [Syntrophobacteraceae bacterium]
MIVRCLGRITEVLVTILMGIVTTAVVFEVFLRYVFGMSLIVTEELSRYLMVWVVFLAAALAIRDGAHIRINAFVGILPGRVRFAVELFAQFLVIVFSIVLTIQGIKILPDQLNQQTTTLGVSLFWFYLAIVLGAALIIVFSLSNILKALSTGGAAEKENREAVELAPQIKISK